jgi:hypothetical protein
MIVSKVKMDFSEASWAMAGRASENVKRVFERMTGMDEARPADEVERMPLASLLYYALMGEGAEV